MSARPHQRTVVSSPLVEQPRAHALLRLSHPVASRRVRPADAAGSRCGAVILSSLFGSSARQPAKGAAALIAGGKRSRQDSGTGSTSRALSSTRRPHLRHRAQGRPQALRRIDRHDNGDGQVHTAVVGEPAGRLLPPRLRAPRALSLFTPASDSAEMSSRGSRSPPSTASTSGPRSC